MGVAVAQLSGRLEQRKLMASRRKQTPLRARGRGQSAERKTSGPKSKAHPLGKPLPEGFRPPWWEPYFAARAWSGTHSGAVKACKISYQTPYTYIRNHPELKEEFDELAQAAREEAGENLLSELNRRGVLGYLKPVIYQGRLQTQLNPETGEEEVVAIRRYSDRALELLFRFHFPEVFKNTARRFVVPQVMPAAVVTVLPISKAPTEE